MLERLSLMSTRGKRITLGALVLLLPVAIWVGYNIGRWMATN